MTPLSEKRPRMKCIRCNKLRKIEIGKTRGFRVIRNDTTMQHIELLNPICRQCMKEFYNWFFAKTPDRMNKCNCAQYERQVCDVCQGVKPWSVLRDKRSKKCVN